MYSKFTVGPVFFLLILFSTQLKCQDKEIVYKTVDTTELRLYFFYPEDVIENKGVDGEQQ